MSESPLAAQSVILTPSQLTPNTRFLRHNFFEKLPHAQDQGRLRKARHLLHCANIIAAPDASPRYFTEAVGVGLLPGLGLGLFPGSPEDSG